MTNTACAVANPYIDVAEVVAALEGFLQLHQPDHDETGMGQRYRSWSTDSWAKGSSISLTDAEPMGYAGVTLSIIAPMIIFPDHINSEKEFESQGSVERFLLDQLACNQEPSAISVFIELERHGYIYSSDMIGIDGISCFRIEGSIELNNLSFDTVCGQEVSPRTVEDFPDFLWTAPGCCPSQQISLGTAHKENVVNEWYQKTYGFEPANARIRSINTTLGDETELMCVR